MDEDCVADGNVIGGKFGLLILKVFNGFVIAAVLASAVVVYSFDFRSVDGGIDPSFKSVEEEIVKEAEARFAKLRNDAFSTVRGPAVNWTWDYWGAGPACEDYTKYTLFDLDEDKTTLLTTSVDALLNQYMSLFQAHNLNLATGLGIAYNGKNIYMNNLGVRNMSTTEPANADTVFSIGSITKIFTSLMMNVLADQGKLDVSDPVEKYYSEQNPPHFHPVNPYDKNAGGRAVTLESLASQSSGLGRETPCLYDENCTEERAVEMTNKFPLFHPPLTRPHYSNFGYALLGHACARAAGADVEYEKWIEENILAPFEMSSSGFNYSQVMDRMAVGYTADGEHGQYQDPSFAQDLGWSNPAGAMYSSLNDMMKFIAHLTQEEGLMSKNAYEQYFLTGPTLPDGVSSYGKSGWEVAYSNGFRTLTKGGVVGGFATAIVVIPQLKLGMFSWVNLISGVIPSMISSQAFNLVAPIIKDALKTNISKHEIPDVANELTGIYVDGTNTEKLSLKATRETENTGVFIGTVVKQPVNFFYDAQATKAVNNPNQYFFRYRTLPEDERACFIDSMDGNDNGLVLFQKKDGKWQASAPDVSLFDLARQVTSSSSSSTTASSAASSTAPSSRSSGSPASASQSSGASTRGVNALLWVVLMVASMFTNKNMFVFTVFAAFAVSAAAFEFERNEQKQAVNWEWDNWMAGGPTCLPKNNLTLVDIPAKVLEPITTAVDQILAKYNTKFGGKLGLALGITYNGKDLHQGFQGVVNISSTDAPTEDTIFGIGSNTKIMTNLLLHRLAEEGALKLSDPVTKYFNEEHKPAFKPVNPYDSKAGADAVTLESLADHTSGLMHDISCKALPTCTEEISINLANQYPLFRKPLTTPSYCNLGFSLLGHCCERAAREFEKNQSLTYEYLMKDRIFDEFGMDSTGFDFTDDVKSRMAIGYVNGGSGFIQSPGFATPIYWYTPCGGAYSSLKDMMTFAKHLLNKDGVLSKSGYEGFFLPGVQLSDGVSSYGRAAWETFYANGLYTFTKSGVAGGFSSEIALIPELKLGIFVWVNLQSSTASQVSAEVANVVVPALLKYLEENQPKMAVPDEVDSILGDYVYIDEQGETPLVSIASDDHTAATGVFVGIVSDTPVWYVYDEVTTTSYGEDDTYFFRHFTMPNPSSDACMVTTMTGTDDGLVMFKKYDDTWHATIIDYGVSGPKKL